MADSPQSVAEMQGLYGPFTIAERVVQKIWLQQDFVTRGATLLDGRSLEISSPGKWNLLGGPDFGAARLRVGGEEVTGDVEVHFRARDWNAHGHATNPAYDRVVLHVLLFPPEPHERPVAMRDGREMATLVLLPLLHRDLEEYAADDALESITARDDWRRIAELAQFSADEVRAQLRERAAARWQRKVGYARQRIARLGWSAAVHHTALEILGYRHNRVPMLAVAERWPLEKWTRDFQPAAIMAAGGVSWQRHGVRPANHPRTRLEQYYAWMLARPDWPQRLLAWAQSAPVDQCGVDEPTAVARRSGRFARLRDALWEDVTARAVRGSRFHTLVCDGFLPLVAAETGRDGFHLWFHWFPGDLPDQMRRALVQLGVTAPGGNALSHGRAQGLLAWLIERELCA